MDETLLERYEQRVYKYFRFCENDQPYDREDQEVIWIEGDRIELSDLLSELRIPEKYHDELSQRLRCPACGSEVNLYSDVGQISEHERLYEEKVNRINALYQDEIADFQKHLERLPYLGLAHRIGKRIQKEVDKLKRIEIVEETWFRARTISSSTVFTRDDMKAPSQEKVTIGEGRYNHYGQSHLYLGESEDTCIREICHDADAICWMQKITITGIANILDISQLLYSYEPEELPIVFSALLYTDRLVKSPSYGHSWKPEYLIPRFVADVAKSEGYSGIKYPSAVASGANLVLFSYKDESIDFVELPYVYRSSSNMLYAELETLF